VRDDLLAEKADGIHHLLMPPRRAHRAEHENFLDAERLIEFEKADALRRGSDAERCAANFVAARPPETENRTHRLGIWDISAVLLGVVRFFLTVAPPWRPCSVSRCKATSITSHTNGRKS
jgi:hypothetical protein